MKTFAALEKDIYNIICASARDVMKYVLEEFDKIILKDRDRLEYCVMGRKKTTVKTLFGEVEYSRRYYRNRETGRIEYLLDKRLKMNTLGLYSETLAQLIVKMATQTSFRRAAEAVSTMTGQTISHGGVWQIVQAVGERADREEKMCVKAMKQDMLDGKEETPVLFEEMDGVYLSVQGKDRKRMHRKKAELKVSIAHKGWVRDGKKLKLAGKVMTAGFHPVRDFHERREAEIRRQYDVDHVQVRILNSDGATWIRNTYERDIHYQLDRFHIEQEITRCIANKKIRYTVRKLLREGQIEKCLEHIRIYADSQTNEKDAETAMRLYTYLSGNRDGLIPYRKRGLKLPPLPDGMI